ncbi:MAG TPA: sigma-70 family RNA polymerase sigma factor [Gemmatimonadota bacterium]|jgi:RNA polymerase sigma-70 factor (ECF subfamily)|nr:sigma-70 family RNA polymerase sigma factor [Gemmatimonadota bacterium]
MLDEQLVDQALSGSQSAYRELVRRFERPIFNLVARMVRDHTVAEDLAQDAFVKAFSRLETYRSEQGKFSNWLFKIAHNTAIDHLRRSNPETYSLDKGDDPDAPDFHALLADPEADTPLEAAERADLGRALGEAVERLRPEYREVIVLRHHEGFAYEEIAEVTQLPLGTVKTYIHRARKELAAYLLAAGWGPPGAGRNPPGKLFVGRAG